MRLTNRRLVETLQLKTYSESTLKTYRNEFAQSLYLLKNHPVDDLTAERLRSYFLYCIGLWMLLKQKKLGKKFDVVYV